MSGIAGIVRWSGPRVLPEDLAPLMGRLADRGPDRQEVWVRGGAGLGHALLATTPEAHGERQPLHDPARGLTVVMDGRLDDREALRRRLAADGLAPRDDSDAGLALLAYARWGAGCAEALLGDYAIAVWDARARRLTLLRDALGPTPLFHARTRDGVVFASEPAIVACAAGVDGRVDEDVLRAHLLFEAFPPDRTLHRGVERLPPGHVLIASDRGRRVRRWWRAPRRVLPQTVDPSACAARYRALLRQAVRDRLRAVGPISADLSGGLDSSSVCALAAGLLREGAGPGGPLLAWSVTEPGAPWDESRYSRAVREHVAVGGGEVKPWRPRPGAVLRLARRVGGHPGFPNGLFFLRAVQAARGAGSRVLLTGQWGDHFLEGTEADLLDHLAHGRWRAWAHAMGEGFGPLRAPLRALRGAWRSVAPLVPGPLRRSLRELKPRRQTPVVPWLGPRAVRRRDDRPGDDDAWRWSREPARDALAALPLGWRFAGFVELHERVVARQGMEMRHPFLDRRLVEFVLALPEPLRCEGRRSKGVLRAAMAGSLPPVVLGRHEKAQFSELYVRALADPAWRRMVRDGPLARGGWVDSPSFEKALGWIVNDPGASLGWEGWAAWSTVVLSAILAGPASLAGE